MRMSATSCACRARRLWTTTQHTDELAALHRSRLPAAGQAGRGMDGEVGRHASACRAGWRGSSHAGVIEFKL